MYKADYKTVQWFTKYGQEVYVGNGEAKPIKEVFGDTQPQGMDVAYYSPSGANWSYIFKYVNVNGAIYEVMTRFGSVEGARLISLPEQKGTEA